MDHTVIPVEAFFPFWNSLEEKQKHDLKIGCKSRTFKKGDIIFPYKDECLGLILVQDGQFRAFILSGEGKEVTLYRLFNYDICLFSASCSMKNIQFDVHIESEKETRVLMIPISLYEQMMGQSIDFAAYMNEIMSSRFSDVMWTLEQIVFKSMDSRIAQFLLDQANIKGAGTLTLTHDSIARDLGTAREVVTRMLNYFQDEHILELGRGNITLLNPDRLSKIAE